MSTSESKWKRSKPSRIYDYNYKVSEGYYKPQTEYLDKRYRTRVEQPPDDTHLSYAERYATRPWYGGTRGLPYDESKAEMNKPLLKPSERIRGSSLVREIQEDEKDDIPLNIRAYRRKKKMEEEEEKLGIRPQPKTLASAGIKKYEPKPHLRADIQSELRKIDDQLNRAMERTRRSPSITSDYTPSYSHAPTRTSSRHEESFTLPSGSRFKKLSQSGSYHSSSSTTRPPVAPRSRNVSLSEETSTVARHPRSRLNSFSSEVTPAMTRSYRHSSITSDDADDELLPVYSNKSAKIREHRRQRESENLTENINKMVEKMRVGGVDPSAAYSYRQSLRASSLEPPPRNSRNKAKALNFVYGVGRL